MSNDYTSDYIFKVAAYVSGHDDCGHTRAWRGIRNYEMRLQENGRYIEAARHALDTVPDKPIDVGSGDCLPTVYKLHRMLKNERQRLVSNNRERQKFLRSVIDFSNNAACVEDHIISAVNGRYGRFYREPMETPKWKRICTDEQLKRAFGWCKDEKFASYQELIAKNHPAITAGEIKAAKPVQAMVYAGAYYGRRYHQGNPIPLLVMLTVSVHKVTVSLRKDMLGEPVWCLGCPSKSLGHLLPAGWFPVLVKPGV